MEERKDHIKRLIQRWMEITITQEERGELVGLLNEQTLLSDVEPGLREIWDAQTRELVLSEDETASMIDHILSNNRPGEKNDPEYRVRPVHFIRRWRWAAAGVILLLGMGVYLWTTGRKDTEP